MSKLPEPKQTFGHLTTPIEAKETLDKILERNIELEEIFQVLQPLLYTLSVAVYGEENDQPVTLAKLVEDSIAVINGRDTPLQ